MNLNHSTLLETLLCLIQYVRGKAWANAFKLHRYVEANPALRTTKPPLWTVVGIK